MDAETIYAAIEEVCTDEVEYEEFEGYPTTGPGFFTIPQMGDEVFMNPNTVSLYDEDLEDWLVGNYIPDSVPATGQPGDPLPQGGSDTTAFLKRFKLIDRMIVRYAINRVYDSDAPIIDRPSLGDSGDQTPTGPTVNIVRQVSDWVVTQNVAPILSDFAEWSQDSPFNDLFPTRLKYLLFGEEATVPAGCFPLAIAKILTHFEYPDSFSYNGALVNWYELKSDFKSLLGGQSAATLLFAISQGCNSLYFAQGTFTFPSFATSYMRSIGYSNAHNHPYSFERVTTMLDDDCPLIIYSVPGNDITSSHSWNIDGYKIKSRMITNNRYENGILTSSSSETQTSNMVHCDFGWEGDYNGYYVSGIFNLADPSVEPDSGCHYGATNNYKNYLKVITYANPID